MREWNAVVTVFTGQFAPACRILEQFGFVQKTDFFNTLVMRTHEPFQALADLHEQLAQNRDMTQCISRFMPMERIFSYRSAEEFELHCREAVLGYLPRLASATFYVRMHRRGFKGRISSMEEEQAMDHFLLEKLSQAGTPGEIAFTDPDVVIIIETIGTQAGMSLLTREQLRRFPLLHMD